MNEQNFLGSGSGVSFCCLRTRTLNMGCCSKGKGSLEAAIVMPCPPLHQCLGLVPCLSLIPLPCKLHYRWEWEHPRRWREEFIPLWHIISVHTYLHGVFYPRSENLARTISSHLYQGCLHMTWVYLRDMLCLLKVIFIHMLHIWTSSCWCCYFPLLSRGLYFFEKCNLRANYHFSDSS